MGKKKIEEMNNVELAKEKKENPSISIVDTPTQVSTDKKEPVIELVRPKEDLSLDTTIKKPKEPEYKFKNERDKKMAKRAKRYLDALEEEEKKLGRKLTKQEITDFGDSRGRWAFNHFNNKSANVGEALGGEYLFGDMSEDSYEKLRAELDHRESARNIAEEEANRPNRLIKSFQLGDKKVDVTKGMQSRIKNWGAQITDTNYITPEQASQLYSELNKYGIETPSVPTKPVTLTELVLNVDDDADEIMKTLGFYDEKNNLTLPHQETFEEMLARREKAEEALRLQTEQRALDRQRARTGLADLAAGIGDMIKASNGAIVTPRDYKAMYDSLTEQQKTNYNNYLARMQAMKEAEKAKAKEAADRAYQEKLLAEQRAYQMAQDKAQRDWQAGEYKKNRDAELAASAIKAQADYLGKENKKISTSFAGNTYTFNSKDQSLQTFNEIFGLIAPKITTKDGVIAPPYGSLLEFDEDGKATKTSLAAIASAAIHSDAVMNDPNLVRKIKDKLNSASYDVEGTGKYGVIAGEEVTESATPYYDLLTKGGSTFNAGASTEATTNTKLKNPFDGQF